MSALLPEQLNNYSESDWLKAIDELLPEIHEVDRNAVQVWFRFFPLELQRYIKSTDETPDELVRKLALQGDFELKDQIDVSHYFLYGHRYWPFVKKSILAESPPFPTLIETIRSIASRSAGEAGIDVSLLIGIAAVGLMTMNQVGIEAFKASNGGITKPTGLMRKSPDAIVSERAKDDSQGLLGFLRTVDKKFSVVFSAPKYMGKFPITAEEEIASASQKDRSRDWRREDTRNWEGPVPIECTAASCGTCWVGVLGGREKLSPVARRERRQMKVFGYNQPADEKPLLRLACQARATGNVTIVIPPWNGVYGKRVYGNIEQVDLEPVTTSAKKLRETIASAIDSPES